MTSGDEARNRSYDVIVWGATGFTGRLVAEYLAENYPATDTLRWAIGGRSRDKLERVAETLSSKGFRPDILVANSHDPKAMDELARQARVILTTVGPYARYGSELVAACVANGTHYCDLCGEAQWIRKMIDLHHDAAAKSGAKIIMCCGFDSIPSDMGVYALQQEAISRHGNPVKNLTLLVRAIKGGASGGTFASMLNAIDEAKRDRSVMRILSDPYGLNPEGERKGPDGRDQRGALFHEDAGVWTGPFVMAGINTKVVRRSNALAGYPYGRDFQYSEATIAGTGLGGRLKAMVTGYSIQMFVLAAAIPLTRKHLLDRKLPKPGEGPSPQQRETGFFNLKLLGRANDGSLMNMRILGDRDPGYGSTSKMLAESSVCLALDDPDIGGGCWTPSVAMGDQLLVRLQNNAGLTFDME